MSEEADKPQLPVASTSILAGKPKSAQPDEVAAESDSHIEQEDQAAPTDDTQAATLTNTPPDSPTSNVPDISISRPSISSITDNGERGIRDEDVEVMSDQPEEANGREEGVATDGPDLNPQHTEAANDDSSLSSPHPKRESQPEFETTMSMQESSAESRRSSVTSTTSTTVHSRSSLSSLNKGSAVFVLSALEQIENSKEAKGSKAGPKALREAAQRALEMVKNASGSGQQPSQTEAELDPRVVFEPLRLACLTGSTNLIITSLDCLGKLVSYSFFAEDVPSAPTENEEEALSDLVTTTVCDTFHDSLDERAQLQIIKALLAVVLSTSVHVHQSSLLKAVRTVYNIFLGSKNTPTQAVAQGVLTQMVHHVFGRVPRGASMGKTGSHRDSTKASAPSRKPSGVVTAQEASTESEGTGEEANEEVPLEEAKDVTRSGQDETQNSAPSEIHKEGEQPAERVTLRTLENRASFEGASERDTVASLMQQSAMSQQELFVKDAFLVLRALCKLSMKPLTAERCVVMS